MPTVLARMERRGISIDRQVLSRLSGEFAQEQGAAGGRDQDARRRAAQSRLAQADRRHSVRQDGAARRHQDQDRAMVDRRARAGRPGRAGPRIAAQDPRLAAGVEAALDLYRGAADLRQPDDAPRAHVLRARRRPRPGGCRRRSRICRTSRCAPRTAARSGKRLRRLARHEAGVGRLLANRVAAAVGSRRRAGAAQGVPGRRRHPRHDRVGNVRRAGQGHAERGAPPRQGDQFRHHLRHLGLRAGQLSSASSARKPAPTSRNISSASPASATTWTRRASSAASTAMCRRCSAASATTRTSRTRNPSIRAFNERAAINARLQGSAADIIRRAMIRIEPELDEGQAQARRCCLQVHDELIFEVPDEEVTPRSPWSKA